MCTDLEVVLVCIVSFPFVFIKLSSIPTLLASHATSLQGTNIPDALHLRVSRLCELTTHHISQLLTVSEPSQSLPISPEKLTSVRQQDIFEHGAVLLSLNSHSYLHIIST